MYKLFKLWRDEGLERDDLDFALKCSQSASNIFIEISK